MGFNKPSNILLLIKNHNGYKNVISLMSKFYNSEENNFINFEDLQKFNEGLICLSGGIHGPIGKSALSNNISLAKKISNKLNNIYKNNFYIELTRSGLDEEKNIENFFLSLAKENNIPIVVFSIHSQGAFLDAVLGKGQFTYIGDVGE